MFRPCFFRAINEDDPVSVSFWRPGSVIRTPKVLWFHLALKLPQVHVGQRETP